MRGISFLLVLAGCATADYRQDPIKTTFHSKDFVYRQCYHESDSYQGRHIEEKRQVDVEFHIEPGGKVTQAQIVKSDFKDPNFHACVLNYVRNLRFLDVTSPLTSTETIYFGHEKL